MRLLGLDVGTKRIGVAVCDELGLLSRPLAVVQRRGGVRDLEAIERLVRQEEVAEMVVGLPLNMDGSEGRMADLARRFAQDLRQRLEMPVHLWDERLSSWEAEGRLAEAGVKPPRRRGLVDAAAAAIILQGYLDARRQGAATGDAR